MLNMCQISSLMGAAEGRMAEFSGFVNFEEKKTKSNHLMSFPKIVNQMGSFWWKKKKKIALLSADSRYFRIYALDFSLKLRPYWPYCHLPAEDDLQNINNGE